MFILFLFIISVLSLIFVEINIVKELYFCNKHKMKK